MMNSRMNNTHNMRHYMSLKRIKIPQAITSFPENEPEKYALFAYFLKLSRQCGANKTTYKTLPTDLAILYEITSQMNPENINLKDKYSQTIFHLAAQYCKADDMNMLLDMKIKCEVEIDAIDNEGYTPLFYAAMANNVDAAEVLVERECRLDVWAGDAQRTVLHVAAMFGAKDMTRFLLQRVSCEIISFER